MELTEMQKQAVAKWVAEGMGLSDIQKQLSSEFGVSMLYMDVRFLVLDLGLSLRDKPEAKADSAPGKAAASAAADSADSSQVAPGGVSVEIDRLQHPGTLVSGSVVFSDGVRAMWAIDAQQRFMLEPEQDGYQPLDEDLQAFQMELRSALGRRGL